MTYTLCNACRDKVDAEVGKLDLPAADSARIKALTLDNVITFVQTRQPPLPTDRCPMCLLTASCTCGKGPGCLYAGWAEVVVAAARHVLYGGGDA